MAPHRLQNSDNIKSFLVIAGLYLLFLSLITAMTGHLVHLGDESLFFLGDGLGYKALADYYTSLGTSQRPADLLLEVRPFLFPLYLGLYRVIGIAGVQFLQIMMNVTSLWCVYVSIKAVSSRSMIAGLCTAVLAVTPSFNFLAFYALTENLSIFLICLFITLIIDHFQHERNRSLYLAAFVVTLLLCVRPVALPFWLLLMVYAFVVWIRDRGKKIWQPAVVLTPICCQLIISYVMVGSVVPASASGSVFAGWYFPVVYGQQEYGKFAHRKTPEGKEGLSRYPETKDKLLYVAKHYPAAIKSYLSLLIGESLLAGSNFAAAGIPDHADRRIVQFVQWWSAKLNRFFACVHILMVGVMTFWIISGRPLFSEKAALACYAFAILLILPAGLLYFQGDRYIILAEPLWLLTYSALAARLVDEWSSRTGLNRLRLNPLKN